MNITKDHTYITDTYTVEDGPVEETAPGHLTRVKFKVDFLSVSYTDGDLGQVYVKGRQVKTDGELGKSSHARTFFGDFPQWILDFLDTVG